MTAASWSSCAAASDDDHRRLRLALGISEEALVFGLVGNLAWNRRYGYCYGLELVRAVARTNRADVVVLIAGDGDGTTHLQHAAGKLLGNRVHLTGRIPHTDVPAYLAAMDIVSLPQSVDRVGTLRYTSKLSEYVAARRPVVTGQIPLAYDLDDGWLWRLPGDTPWDETYVDALAGLMTTVKRSDVVAKMSAFPKDDWLFSRARQQRQAANFIRDLLAL
jgi:hypothetical protein